MKSAPFGINEMKCTTSVLASTYGYVLNASRHRFHRDFKTIRQRIRTMRCPISTCTGYVDSSHKSLKSQLSQEFVMPPRWTEARATQIYGAIQIFLRSKRTRRVAAAVDLAITSEHAIELANELFVRLATDSLSYRLLVTASDSEEIQRLIHKFAGWHFRNIVNRDILRWRTKNRELTLEAQLDTSTRRNGFPYLVAADLQVANEPRANAWLFAMTLPRKLLSVVELRAVGYSLGEIARMLRISTKTVSRRLNVACAFIKQNADLN